MPREFDAKEARTIAQKRGNFTGREKSAIAGIIKVEKWLKKRRTVLEWSAESECIDKTRITLASRPAFAVQLALLLHECGHLLMINEPEPDHKRDSYAYLVAELEDELRAWAKGKKLAARLKVKLDDDVWLSTKTQTIMTYIDYILVTIKERESRVQAADVVVPSDTEELEACTPAGESDSNANDVLKP